MTETTCLESTARWNNFTLSELKKILSHCAALERIGIAQDQEMMVSIQRDIELIEKNKRRSVHH
jgi:hypothetical protein